MADTVIFTRFCRYMGQWQIRLDLLDSATIWVSGRYGYCSGLKIRGSWFDPNLTHALAGITQFVRSCGHSTMVSAPACHAGDVGSIPIARSIALLVQWIRMHDYGSYDEGSNPSRGTY